MYTRKLLILEEILMLKRNKVYFTASDWIVNDIIMFYTKSNLEYNVIKHKLYLCSYF